MKVSIKRWSLVLAVAMVLSLFAAFPVVSVSAADPVEPSTPYTNVADQATYKGDGQDNGTSGNYCEAPGTEWEEYHTGKLNDGIIPEADSEATKGHNVEVYRNDYLPGLITLTFKFEAEINVKAVNVYMNSRSTNANCGYPDKIEVYVGNSEDVAEATLMGEATTADETDVRKYSVSGDLSGTYVIFNVTAGAKWRITFSEVEVMVDADPVNHAPNAQYKGDGEDNGTSGKYCDDGNWEEYHQGKLNDGVIPEGDSGTTLYQNVEFWLTGVVGGTAYVYFAFDYEVDVREVIAYMNFRVSSQNNRSYPEKVNVYVGNSEDVTAATLLGEATTTDPEGAVRAYSVSGEASGTYVIFEFTVSNDKPAICLSEVEIMGFGTPVAPVLPNLAAPVISGNLDRMETFVAPTISWDAVEGAVSYDAYIDGRLVTEGITETSYVPDMDPVVGYSGNTNYTKVQIVAKGDGVNYADSELSESYNFFYVNMPTDKNGNPVSSADIIIDPGHGGSQPGAVGVYADGSERLEKVDTLNMSLKLGEYFEAMGYTVAFTRITDTDDGLMSRAAKANAGEFDLFICVHRNSFSDERAKGIETLHETDDPLDTAFAQAVQDEMVKLNLFTNRGLKPRDNLVVLNNVKDTIPTILVELGFLSNENDNILFDENFDALARAIVKGSMAYQGNEISYKGNVSVGEQSAEINGAAAELTVNTIADGDTVKVEGMLFSGTDLSAVEYSVNGGEWVSAAVELVEADASGYKQITNNYYSFQLDTASLAGVDTVVTVRGTTALGEVFDIATVTFALVPTFDMGDVNTDGTVDSADAALVLQFDVDLISGVENGDITLGDVNADGAVDSADASLILQFDLGLIEEF